MARADGALWNAIYTIPGDLRAGAEHAADGDPHDRDVAVERAIIDLVRDLKRSVEWRSRAWFG